MALILVIGWWSLRRGGWGAITLMRAVTFRGPITFRWAVTLRGPITLRRIRLLIRIDIWSLLS
jgi:hypothetical protein